MIMTEINLLPWREENRQEQKKQFVVMLVMVCVFAAAIVGLIHFQMQAKIDYQLSRNKFLSNEIATVDEEIKEIKELQKVRRSLIERMEVIQDLQGSRPSIVHLFTEIVSTVPNGVYLQSLATNRQQPEDQEVRPSQTRGYRPTCAICSPRPGSRSRI